MVVVVRVGVVEVMFVVVGLVGLGGGSGSDDCGGGVGGGGGRW